MSAYLIPGNTRMQLARVKVPPLKYPIQGPINPGRMARIFGILRKTFLQRRFGQPHPDLLGSCGENNSGKERAEKKSKETEPVESSCRWDISRFVPVCPWDNPGRLLILHSGSPLCIWNTIGVEGRQKKSKEKMMRAACESFLGGHDAHALR